MGCLLIPEVWILRAAMSAIFPFTAARSRRSVFAGLRRCRTSFVCGAGRSYRPAAWVLCHCRPFVVRCRSVPGAHRVGRLCHRPPVELRPPFLSGRRAPVDPPPWGPRDAAEPIAGPAGWTSLGPVPGGGNGFLGCRTVPVPELTGSGRARGAAETHMTGAAVGGVVGACGHPVAVAVRRVAQVGARGSPWPRLRAVLAGRSGSATARRCARWCSSSRCTTPTRCPRCGTGRGRWPDRR